MPARHLLCGDPADLRAGFLAVWLDWRTPERIAERLHVVVPTRTHRAALKRLLVEAGEPIFNVSFLLPNHLRTLLSEELLAEREPLWGREELDFLLRQLAQRLADESPLCRSLAHDPSPLRRALDELANAGHTFRSLLGASGTGANDPAHRDLDLLRRAWERVEANLLPGLRAGRDHRLREAARTLTRPGPSLVPGRLLVFGCDIRNAADFALIEAALLAWREPAVLTLLAAAGQETVQGPWLNLVERTLPGAITSLPESAIPEIELPPEDDQLDLFSAPPQKTETALKCYLAPGRDAAADLIVRQTRAWLHEHRKGPAPRIGLVFPAASPLASRVAQLLRDGGLPFTSAFPTPLPLRFEQSLLRDWLALQRGGLWAEPFLLFWRKAISVPAFAERFGEPLLWGGALEDRFARAYSQILSDQVPVLAAFLKGQGKPLPALENFLAWWNREGLWPEEARLSVHLDRFAAQLDLLVGPHLGRPIRGFLEKELSRLAAHWESPVSRAAACQLLESFVTRAEVARDFTDWAPVHLVTPEAARALEWDCLLLADLEEGSWPRLDRPATFLDDALRERLNRQSQDASPSGGGETVYAPSFAPLLTATTHYRLARETFASLLESARHEIALCAAVWDEVEANRRLYPSEFFRQAWEERHPKEGPWSDAIEQSLLHAANPSIVPAASDPSIEAMLRAYHSRRNPRLPFDEYSFMLQARPSAHPLSAKAAEATLQDPATAWFRHFLKIEVERPAWSPEEQWPLFQGLILHRLFERALTSFGNGSPWIALPAHAAWLQALDHEWEEAARVLQTAYREARQPMPAWWTSEWPRLRSALHQLAEKLRLQLPDGLTHLAAEFKLELPVPADDPLLPPLPWRSRADLIAINAPRPEEATRALIADFKTGTGAPDFKPAETAAKAAYFQLVVYAAQLRAAYPNLKETSLLVLHRSSAAPAAPSEIDPTSPAYAPLWRVVRAAWTEGHWGQYLAIRDRFKKTSTLPLATLEIPDHLLTEKWSQTEALNAWERKRD